MTDMDYMLKELNRIANALERIADRTSRPRKSSKHKCLPLTAGIHFFNETAVNPLPLGMGWLSVENNKEDGAGMDPAPSVFCQSIFSIQMIAERSIVSR